MFNISTHKINELCTFSYISDKSTRDDLANGLLADENDYTSRLITRLHDKINSESRYGLKAEVRKLAGKQEQNAGCDCVIIICSNGYLKLAIFESKWPRFKKKNYPWDKIQFKPSTSHFSLQLSNQKQLTSVAAVFEIFYCELSHGNQPHFLCKDVSPCVWHDHAIKYDMAKKRNSQFCWNTNDLLSILKQQCLTLDHILESVCLCNQGTAHSITSDPWDTVKYLLEFRDTNYIAIFT